MAIVRLQHHAVAIDVGGGHGFFAQDVLAGLHQGDGLLGVAEIGAGDVDGIDLGAGGQRGEVGEGEGGFPPGGEFGGALPGTGIDGGEGEFGVLFGFGEELFDDMAGADGGKTDHGGTSLGGVMGWCRGWCRGRGGAAGPAAEPPLRTQSAESVRRTDWPAARILRLAGIRRGAG